MAVIEALIDSDLVAFRCAATCEGDDTPDVVLYRCNELVERILDRVDATDYTLYLTGATNFRKEINPEYKANRKDKPRPKWLETCREFLVKEWNAKVTDGIEADDALGIAQREDTFICSLDKDLLQVPGMHYNWVKDEEYYISEREGLQNFWTQTIVGDVADNVFGIYGLGPVKTRKILEQVEGDTLEELDENYYQAVKALYDSHDRLHMNAKCLWVLREEGGIWVPPAERKQVSTEVDSKPNLPKASKPKVSKPATRKTKSSSPSPVVNEPTTLTGQSDLEFT